jgi:hypothetical protein
MTVVQGNPATPVAETGIIFSADVSVKEFSRQLRPPGRKAAANQTKSK